VRIRVGVAVIAAVATQLSLPLLMTAVAGAAEAAVIPVNLSVAASLTAEDQGGGTTVADPARVQIHWAVVIAYSSTLMLVFRPTIRPQQEKSP